MTDGVAGDLVLVRPNDLAAVARAIDEHQPACVIHEGNGTHWGVVPARAEFLRGLRKLTREKNVLLILDEVITGFRVAPGGFQAICRIEPDLSTFAKVLAGGLPGGCLAGRADVMQVLAFNNPLGKKMKHPGTYNANPLSAAAGCAALSLVATGEPCRASQRRGSLPAPRLERAVRAQERELDRLRRFLGDQDSARIRRSAPRRDDFIPYDNDFRKLDRKFDPTLSHAFRCALLLGGVDWMGWGGSTSSAHTEADVDRTVDGFSNAIDFLRSDGLID